MSTVEASTVLAMLDKAVARQLRRAANKISEGLEERNRLIIEAKNAGATEREIAEHAGVSHVAVHKIIHRDQS